jgi:hypothetical protein
MNHPAFVTYLKNENRFAPCGSNGCLAHIPCDWLTFENFNAAAERREAWLKQQVVSIENILKPTSQSEGWCVLCANNGAHADSETFLLPKYWLGNPAILDRNAPPILAHRYKLAIEFFWRKSSRTIKLSCRSMDNSPHSLLCKLRDELNLNPSDPRGQPPTHSASSVVIGADQEFGVLDYESMGSWLLDVLQNPDHDFKDFVLLAPAFL